jgi:aminopeptidase N
MAGNDQLREPWLDEGISEFAASYFFGDFHGYASNRPVNSRVYDFPNEPASLSSNDPNSYDQTIYYKSAKFLEGLRIRMGTTRFFDGMRALFAANRNMVITSQEFVDIMAKYGASRTYMAQFIRP